MPYPIRNPMTAPSNDRIKLTSIPNTPTNVEHIRNTVVKMLNSVFSRCGLLTKVINYFLVKKNMIGRTEKF